MKPLVLMILDGFGYNPESYGNAIKAAKTPYYDSLLSSCPNTLLGASGLDVGLPDGQMGNSEVGHTNIGAGRIVYQELTRISEMVKSKKLYENAVLTSAMDKACEQGCALHLAGLLSDGGVHSHTSHLYALLDMAKSRGLKKVYIHCFMDGRDVSPTSGAGFIKELSAKIKEIGIGEIATVGGRYYAMDRDKHWDRVKKHFDAMISGEAPFYADGAKAIENFYSEGITDEFIPPFICTKGAEIKENDSFIFYNFRPDRAREITRALTDTDFDGFSRGEGFPHINYVCMTQYDKTIANVSIAFPPQSLNDTFGMYISKMGKTQLRIAETEKYAHVTFFFNGGVEAPYENEERILVPSPAVATYDLKPDMSAIEVTDKLLSALSEDKFDVVILNYANCDMVGHTGVFDAAVKAVETVDTCMEKITKKVKELGGICLITADHGNADVMLTPEGEPFTAHSTNPVPFVVFNHECKLRAGGKLCDIAPTMLSLMGLPIPEEMSGESLII